MEFELRPLVSAGPIEFGMNREEVRRVLGVMPTEFRKTPDAELPTDDFHELDLHVYYEGAFECVGVEFWPGSKLVYEGREIVARPLDEVMAWLRLKDSEAKLVDSLVISRRLGVSIYAPDADEGPKARIESVYTFRHWP